MSTKVPATVVPYPPVPGTPSGVGTFFPNHPYGTSLRVGLAAYWNLDEASGQRNDSFGANALTDNNTVTSTSDPTFGTVAEFTTANSESLSRSLVFTQSNPHTISGWIYLPQLNVNQPMYGISDSVADGSPSEFVRMMQAGNDGQGVASFTIQMYAFAGYATSVGNFYKVGWHHFCVVTDASNTTVYMNGSVQEAQKAKPSGGNSSLITIGACYSSLYGTIKMSRIGAWSRALTADERLLLYNGGLGRKYADL